MMLTRIGTPVEILRQYAKYILSVFNITIAELIEKTVNKKINPAANRKVSVTAGLD